MNKKYKLIHTKTKEETICEKVVLDGFDYYVSDEMPNNMDYYYAYIEFENKYKIGQRINVSDAGYKHSKKVICTNNPNIDIPKIVDEETIFANQINQKLDYDNGRWYGRIEGYVEAKETYKFTEQDMIEFSEWYFRGTFNPELHKDFKSTKELLDIWKSQQPITIYYQ